MKAESAPARRSKSHAGGIRGPSIRPSLNRPSWTEAVISDGQARFSGKYYVPGSATDSGSKGRGNGAESGDGTCGGLSAALLWGVTLLRGIRPIYPDGGLKMAQTHSTCFAFSLDAECVHGWKEKPGGSLNPFGGPGIPAPGRTSSRRP